MGIVYAASDLWLDRAVALKVVRKDVADRRAAFRQLEREAVAMARASSPHVCSVHDVAAWQGRPCLVMERIDGLTLQARIAARSITTAEALDLSRQIAEALEAVHHVGLIHQDVKPSNVMVTAAGLVKLIDFGLAESYESASRHRDLRRSCRRSVMGTTNYIAPERILGRTLDNRSDLFSLGVVIYELVTGQQPFAGDSPAEVVFKVLDSTPLPVRVQGFNGGTEIDRVVRTLLAKDPERRHGSATEVIQELAKIHMAAAGAVRAVKVQRRSSMQGSSSCLPLRQSPATGQRPSSGRWPAQHRPRPKATETPISRRYSSTISPR
jgi:serine/threonine protein kinase